MFKKNPNWCGLWVLLVKIPGNGGKYLENVEHVISYITLSSSFLFDKGFEILAFIDKFLDGNRLQFLIRKKSNFL